MLFGMSNNTYGHF